jgi:hypothetical protein
VVGRRIVRRIGRQLERHGEMLAEFSGPSIRRVRPIARRRALFFPGGRGTLVVRKIPPFGIIAPRRPRGRYARDLRPNRRIRTAATTHREVAAR